MTRFALRFALASAFTALPAIAMAQGSTTKPATKTPAATAPAAAPSPLTRVMLQTKPLVTSPGRDAITARAELAVGGSAPRHMHTGEEIGYVLEGTAVAVVEGRPDQQLKPGDTFFIPPNTPHLVRNTGKVVWKAVSTYLIETGKPLAIAVPK